jgi:hypothetical protein
LTTATALAANAKLIISCTTVLEHVSLHNVTTLLQISLGIERFFSALYFEMRQTRINFSNGRWRHRGIDDEKRQDTN